MDNTPRYIENVLLRHYLDKCNMKLLFQEQRCFTDISKHQGHRHIHNFTSWIVLHHIDSLRRHKCLVGPADNDFV